MTFATLGGLKWTLLNNTSFLPIQIAHKYAILTIDLIAILLSLCCTRFSPSKNYSKLSQSGGRVLHQLLTAVRTSIDLSQRQKRWSRFSGDLRQRGQLPLFSWMFLFSRLSIVGSRFNLARHRNRLILLGTSLIQKVAGSFPCRRISSRRRLRDATVKRPELSRTHLHPSSPLPN